MHWLSYLESDMSFLFNEVILSKSRPFLFIHVILRFRFIIFQPFLSNLLHGNLLNLIFLFSSLHTLCCTSQSLLQIPHSFFKFINFSGLIAPWFPAFLKMSLHCHHSHHAIEEVLLVSATITKLVDHFVQVCSSNPGFLRKDAHK